MGTDISDFGVGGRGCQDVGDILPGGRPSGATFWVRYMVLDTMNWQETGLFYHRLDLFLTGKQPRMGTYRIWRCPPLADVMVESGLE